MTMILTLSKDVRACCVQLSECSGNTGAWLTTGHRAELAPDHRSLTRSWYWTQEPATSLTSAWSSVTSSTTSSSCSLGCYCWLGLPSLFLFHRFVITSFISDSSWIWTFKYFQSFLVCLWLKILNIFLCFSNSHWNSSNRSPPELSTRLPQ